MTFNEAEQVFDGVMLSDGGLVREKPTHLARFNMGLSDRAIPANEFLVYLECIADALRCLGVEISPGYPKLADRVSKGIPYTEAVLSTLTSEYLTIEHDRWYPGFASKEVPEDLNLTPIVLAFWFMGDGSSSFDKRIGPGRLSSARVGIKHPDFYHRTVYVRLCTEGFNIGSVELLEEKLHSLGIYTTRMHRQISKGSGITIRLRQGSVDKFMNMVEPYILAPYEYKVKRRNDCQTTR